MKFFIVIVKFICVTCRRTLQEILHCLNKAFQSTGYCGHGSTQADRERRTRLSRDHHSDGDTRTLPLDWVAANYR